MLSWLDEIIPVQAIITTAGGESTGQFQLTGQYAEFIPHFVAWGDNKAIVKSDTDRSPVQVQIYDSQNKSYIRTPVDIFDLNDYFSLEATKPMLIGNRTYYFKFTHDNTVMTTSPSDIAVPITCYANLYVAYLTKEQYDARVSARGIDNYKS